MVYHLDPVGTPQAPPIGRRAGLKGVLVVCGGVNFLRIEKTGKTMDDEALAPICWLPYPQGRPDGTPFIEDSAG